MSWPTGEWGQLADGYRTPDIMQPGMTKLGTAAMTDQVLKALDTLNT